MGSSTSTYISESIGDEKIKFTVSAAEGRAPIGRALFLGILGFVLGGHLFRINNYGGTSHDWGLASFIFGIIGSVALFKLFRKYSRSQDKKMRGDGGTFVVSKAGINFTDGASVPTERIHRLVMRNAFSGAVIPYAQGGVVAGGTGAVGMGMAAGAAVGSAIANAGTAIAQADIQRGTAIGYRLDVEYGGAAKTLAGGMTETTAYGLMQDVANVLALAK